MPEVQAVEGGKPMAHRKTTGSTIRFGLELKSLGHIGTRHDDRCPGGAFVGFPIGQVVAAAGNVEIHPVPMVRTATAHNHARAVPIV